MNNALNIATGIGSLFAVVLSAVVGYLTYRGNRKLEERNQDFEAIRAHNEIIVKDNETQRALTKACEERCRQLEAKVQKLSEENRELRMEQLMLKLHINRLEGNS